MGRTIIFLFLNILSSRVTKHFCMNFVFLSHIHLATTQGLSISTHLEYDEPPKQTPAGGIFFVKSLARDVRVLVIAGRNFVVSFAMFG